MEEPIVTVPWAAGSERRNSVSAFCLTPAMPLCLGGNSAELGDCCSVMAALGAEHHPGCDVVC